MIHVMIAKERREAPRELAVVQDGQLHSMGSRVADFTDPQILYAAEWDQVSPYVILHKGAIADLKLAYAGWPMVDKVAYEARLPEEGPLK